MKWRALGVLSLAQFLMVLDQAVMNVSISQLVEDFDTTVTTIQGVITFYALTMAALMITGGKLGDRWGRKRAFSIGLIIYGLGSALTAVSGTVPTLLFGWSILEGIGAALVLPALVSMVATAYKGADRAIAYGVLGGVAGAGIAVGPILGGWVTTNFTWRYVFVGEVVVVLIILATLGFLASTPKADPPPEVDWVGSALSATGLGLFVYGILQASAWGWISNVDSPATPFGLALTPFVVGAGLIVLGLFWRWSERRTRLGLEPLFRLRLMKVRPFTGGLKMFLAQNLILMGIFFALPLYLQVVQGLDALDTGLRMLPISVVMFITSFVGAALSKKWTPQQIVRAGLLVLLVAVLVLMQTIEPTLDGTMFTLSMSLLGLGMGLLASQLGNVIQSSVGNKDRSEAGGLQYTAQQLGSALGTALIGAIVIGALATTFINQVAEDPRISVAVSEDIGTSLNGTVAFIPSEDLAEILANEPMTDDEVAAVVESYEQGQIDALRFGLLAALGIVVGALFLVRQIPNKSFDEMTAEAAEAENAEPDEGALV